MHLLLISLSGLLISCHLLQLYGVLRNYSVVKREKLVITVESNYSIISSSLDIGVYKSVPDKPKKRSQASREILPLYDYRPRTTMLTAILSPTSSSYSGCPDPTRYLFINHHSQGPDYEVQSTPLSPHPCSNQMSQSIASTPLHWTFFLAVMYLEAARTVPKP